MVTIDKLQHLQDKINDILCDNQDGLRALFEELGIDDGYLNYDHNIIRTSSKCHGGDNPSGFSFDQTNLTWKCWTANCQDKTNRHLSGLVMIMKGCSYKKAIEWLSGFLKIDENYQETQEEIESREQMKAAREAKIQQLGPSTGEFEPFPIERLQVEPSPYFLNLGFTRKTLEKFHVGESHKDGSKLKNRAYAPVLDISGHLVVGATGRILLDKCPICNEFHYGKICPCDAPNKVFRLPKWKHYGFRSSGVFYNYKNALDSMRKTSSIILTEGPKEVWFLDQYNISACCLFGLKVHKFHIAKMLEAGVRKLVLSLDSDEKGLKAEESITNKLGQYFQIINMKQDLANEIEFKGDIDEIDKNTMSKIIVPYINSL